MKSETTPQDAALQLLPAPVTVIGVRGSDQTGGLTAAWVTRVSLAPPMMLVAVGRERRTWDLLAETTELTISVLQADQVEIARLFGLHSRRDIDKWDQVDHVLLGDGTPALASCAARYLCRVASRFGTGDHDCFVAEVLDAESVDGGPTLPLRGADYAPR